ncbi:predicted protein [Sclerotinia sclerotiorum 1980 UF-70]|uniref:Uncharacterized protein n=1 Tax=Sclerotinia sclerotiorum (strain ATCC 18683 / 1980 / Ss-1) TaxID=665079 RepID=A7EX78_SCLS1|nr:predicted protein [Sclerotinia sclerotiorum 1980 UF-70]EDN94070.1 predicted protein [Sclerotinia sclerotiorum 1980 UF-70]
MLLQQDAIINEYRIIKIGIRNKAFVQPQTSRNQVWNVISVKEKASMQHAHNLRPDEQLRGKERIASLGHPTK